MDFHVNIEHLRFLKRLQIWNVSRSQVKVPLTEAGFNFKTLEGESVRSIIQTLFSNGKLDVIFKNILLRLSFLNPELLKKN